MKIGGLQRFSLIDFPKKISAVVFTQGCLFRCPFCHNPSLVLQEQFGPSLSIEEVLSFLTLRKNQIDGVVISGGEPTIQPLLEDFIRKVKTLGLAIKLDTSGICPEVLEYLLQENLLDYVAMDIKAPLDKYAEIVGVKIDTAKIAKSITLLKNSSIDYEFRSTILPSLHTKEDILAMGKLVSGAMRYVLQTFSPEITLDQTLKTAKGFSPNEMEELAQLIRPFVKECSFR